ncbi:MAG: hypothetical protein JO211_07570 [Acidobacteriaceae bacterium]|nr:hypothetical protein [Acidobacteriaceae bacterium]
MRMTVAILTVVASLFAVVAGLLAVVIAGIRKGDRAHLADAPKSHSDTIARRILVGVRYHDSGEQEK